MSSKVVCPSCGASDFNKSEKVATKQLTLGPEFSYADVVYHCNNCGEEGDFTAESDKNYSAAVKVAEEEAVRALIESLNNEYHLSMAYIERAFELPGRTLTRWKSGDFSAVSLALLRTVQTYPWIVKVAENRFDPNYAKTSVLAEATQIFGQVLSSSKSKVEVSIFEDDSIIFANAAIARSKGEDAGESIEFTTQNMAVTGG